MDVDDAYRSDVIGNNRRMNKIEKWIEVNKTKRNESWNWRTDGYYIEDILPSTFETYAIIYHPYKLPLEQLVTNEQSEQKEKKLFILKMNKLISTEFEIPIVELPIEEYDIEQTIKEKVNKKNISELELEVKIKRLEKQLLSIAFQPLQKINDNINSFENEVIQRRESKWQEVFNFYKINFNENSSWYDTFELDAKSKIHNAEMPDQDNIPISIMQTIGKFLINQGVTNVNINSLSNTIGFQQLIHEKSENRNLEEIVEYDNIHILNSLDNDWIFINPYDYCRTIVASSKEFIERLRKTTELEMSKLLTSKHRFNKMYTDNKW